MCSVYEDAELLAWLRYVEKNGTSFLRTLSEAAFLADTPHYNPLRPTSLKLMEMHPQSSLTPQSDNQAQ